MATETKKTPAEKIIANLQLLTKVSVERKQIDALASLTDNPKLQEFVLGQATRYDEDIKYLRKNIAYQAMKASENMKTDAFETFAMGLAELIS